MISKETVFWHISANGGLAVLVASDFLCSLHTTAILGLGYAGVLACWAAYITARKYRKKLPSLR